MNRMSFLLLAILSMPQMALAKSQSVVLNVPAMECETCPLTIKAALLKVPGVASAKVSYQRREAVVVFDDGKTDVGALKKATADAGYPSFLKD